MSSASSIFRDPLILTHHGAVEYCRFAIRLAHALIATLPGLVLHVLQVGWGNVFTENSLAVLLFLGLMTVLVFQARGIYNDQLFSNLPRVRAMAFSWGIAFCILLFVFQVLIPFDRPGETMLLVWFVASLVGLILSRLAMLWLFRVLRRHNLFLQRAVIIGCTENTLHLAEYLRQHGDIRLGVIGFINERTGTRSGKTVDMSGADLPVLGDIKHLYHLIREDEIHTVLVALPSSDEQGIERILNTLRMYPVNVLLVPDAMVLRYAHNRISEVAGLSLFNVAQAPLRGWSPLLKRMEDVCLGSVCLIIVLPLMLCIALAIKLSSPGPVLFLQKRYGYNNRLIEVCKFRSMYVAQSDQDGAVQTRRDDRRVTPVGRFIRKTSLDELPQLFNVLQGSMSLVGPRPHATATKAANILFEDAVEEYAARHRVKPGITGWAQVNGYRGETDTLEKIQKRVEYDLEYIEQWSLWFDLYILCRTLPAVLLAREAY